MSTAIVKPESTLPPGSWLGVLGGGQLGRMFCMAAQSMGFKVCVLDPSKDSPAGSVADLHLRADYLDEAALAELASLCRAITTEFENVPSQALASLAEKTIVSPRAKSVAIAQDRIAEKAFVEKLGLDVVPFAAIASRDVLEQLSAAEQARLLPGLLKSARMGYDGKGQAQITSLAQALEAFDGMGAVPCVLEKRCTLIRELSVVVARAFDAETAVYPVSDNLHQDGILARSTSPAHIDAGLALKACDAAVKIVHGLDYVGVLCVEFFVLDDGSLVVNEMAPRPHNSGHYTIDACVTSQFEQQARILAGWPLGSTQVHEPSVMLNILGDIWFEGTSGDSAREPNWLQVVKHPRAKLHLYGKTEARPGRKMGHVTVLGDSSELAMAVVKRIEQDLGVERH
jgi:5-(carboxyamino)imidazole ribonucleotide synthase